MTMHPRRRCCVRVARYERKRRRAEARQAFYIIAGATLVAVLLIAGATFMSIRLFAQ
jgi:hypothetical protein